MLEGTKRLFPTDYQRFKETMIEAANEDELPVTLQMDDIKDYTLKDFQDTFTEFNLETGLEIVGSLFLCKDCSKLHVMLVIDRPENEEKHLLQ